MNKRHIYFTHWVGEHYKTGIDGNTILVIGVQHYCDPKFWHCDVEDPCDCLEKRDSTCTVWNSVKYQAKKEKDPKKKPIGWNHTENNAMEICPLYKTCEKNGNMICSEHRFRYLHCETKISVYDHITNKERTRRTSVFIQVLNALKSIFPKKFSSYSKDPNDMDEKQKRTYWDYIVFTNYIQHYTKLYCNGISLDPEELTIQDNKNDDNFNKRLQEFKPDIIIVLIEEQILKIIKGILGNKYIHLKEKDAPNKFYILTKPSSKLYQSMPNITDIANDFIQYYVNDWEKPTAHTTRNIEGLTRFLKEMEIKGQKLKKNLTEIRVMILDKCNSKIKKEYTKEDGKYNDNTFSSNSSKSKKLDEEIESVKKKFNEWYGNYPSKQ